MKVPARLGERNRKIFKMVMDGEKFSSVAKYMSTNLSDISYSFYGVFFILNGRYRVLPSVDGPGQMRLIRSKKDKFISLLDNYKPKYEEDLIDNLSTRLRNSLLENGIRSKAEFTSAAKSGEFEITPSNKIRFRGKKCSISKVSFKELCRLFELEIVKWK